MQRLSHDITPPDCSSKSLLRSKKTVLLILAVAVITLLVSTAISLWLARTNKLHLPSLGTIKTIGVEAYWDANLTDKIDEGEYVDWGTLWLGSSTNATIHLKSISNIPTTLNPLKNNLTFYDTEDLPIYPPATILIHMNLTWNYNGTMISPGDDIRVILTLSAQSSLDFAHYLIENDVRRFTVDVFISTTEYAD